MCKYNFPICATSCLILPCPCAKPQTLSEPPDFGEKAGYPTATSSLVHNWSDGYGGTTAEMLASADDRDGNNLLTVHHSGADFLKAVAAGRGWERPEWQRGSPG